MVLYIDEIVPGNVLRPDNGRKIMAFYYSWVELGQFLRNEEAWLLGAVLRAEVFKVLRGGISAAVKEYLRDAFAGDLSLSSAGVAVDGKIFFCCFSRLLADDAAGRAVWGAKGASGIRCCMDCLNVVHNAVDAVAVHERRLLPRLFHPRAEASSNWPSTTVRRNPLP